MSVSCRVVAAPGFAGGRLRTFNQVLLAAARAGSLAQVELVFDENLVRDVDLLLRTLNAHGDPVGLPAPHRGLLRDAHDRAMWVAALRDTMSPTREGPSAIECFLPAPKTELLEAAVQLWRALLPELQVRAIARGEADTEEVPAAEENVRIVWIGPHQRRALDELGLRPEELAREDDDASERYRPALGGELAETTESLRVALGEPLARLREICLEVDPGLIGAWSRMERLMRRGLDDFAGSAERCLDNHSGIRRTRWHNTAQALRPAGEPQELGLGVLAAVAQFRLLPGEWERYTRELLSITSPIPSDGPVTLFLDC